MSNQKTKSENYQEFGGINSKQSPYSTGPMEFLDLVNLDFQTPGSLSQRWGSTQYIGQTYPGAINSLFEFSRLDGSSYIIKSFSGGIFYGATTGNAQGMSFTLQGATLSLFSFVSSYAHAPVTLTPSETLQSVLYFGSPDILISGSTSAAFDINPVRPSDGYESYAVLDDYLFACDGNKFFKFDGVTTSPVGLPPPLRAYSAAGGTGIGASVYYSNLVGPTGSFGASDFIGIGMTGGYAIYASYVNNRGFEGPLWPISYFLGASFMNGASAAGLGGTFLVSNIPLATPLQYGISAINQYIFWGPSLTGSDFVPSQGGTDFWGGFGGQMRLASTTPASGSTITYIAIGSTINGQTFLTTNAGALPPTNQYQPLGITLINRGPYTETDEIDQIQFAPRFLETYQNRLFLAGFSTAPSTVWFSDVAEPEGYDPDFNFEVRTNDSDVVTAIRAYSTRLYIGKYKSFHILTGDNPNNFFLQQVSDQYGIVNNRCTAIYDDIFLFLDRKGVMEWNGASVTRLSQKIQPLFDRMNYAAAVNQACMVHDKLRNQVLVSIPVDGSTTNNITAVYDYIIGGWTTYKGVNIASLAQMQGRNGTKNAFYGDYNGRVNWFGSSFMSDNGTGATTYWKTRFLHDLGDSTSKTFRRMYLNTDSPASSTLVFGVNFYQDYGSSVVLGTTIVLSQFQNRIDFGIQGAKSVAFEMSNLQTALPLRIHGFTIESRFTRST